MKRKRLKFDTKRERWEWIQKNMPGFAALILEMKEAGLNPGMPEIWSQQ